MRRGLTWLVAAPLLVAGSQAAHSLTYRLVYPGAPARLSALEVAGHGYLDRLPLVLGVALAVALVALPYDAGARPYGLPGASLVSWRGLPSRLARR
jgi:hypothetical protein